LQIALIHRWQSFGCVGHPQETQHFCSAMMTGTDSAPYLPKGAPMFHKAIDITQATELDTAFARRLVEQTGISDTDALARIERTTLFGLKLVNSTLDEVAEALAVRAGFGPKTVGYFVNAHCINYREKSREYKNTVENADVLLPDGAGLRIAGRLCGTRNIPNLNGTDLFPHLCKHAARYGQAIFALGGQPGVAKLAMDRMQSTIAGLDCAGSHDGYFGEKTEQALIDEINASGAAILLVGMGVPSQELWIARNRSKLDVPLILGVGGLFDYYSGRIPRAPRLVRDLSLEWCWRLMLEPVRLGRRYVVGNLQFLIHACAAAIKHRRIDRLISARIKRVLDIAISLVAIVAVAPLMAVAAALIKFQDGGPIFFGQTRIGERGRPFYIKKFRSMSVDAPALRVGLLSMSDRDSVCFKMTNDPRVTRIGRWLRQYSIDELPQLFNILKGEMSLVGPRPALPEEVLCYSKSDGKRLSGRPGLTGIWQTSGRAHVPFKKQMVMDVYYVRRRSLLMDIFIIAKTVPVVLLKHGSY
jgi:exopolysaccharide biosynthesis WecB/TagA/CpsF family protein